MPQATNTTSDTQSVVSTNPQGYDLSKFEQLTVTHIKPPALLFQIIDLDQHSNTFVNNRKANYESQGYEVEITTISIEEIKRFLNTGDIKHLSGLVEKFKWLRERSQQCGKLPAICELDMHGANPDTDVTEWYRSGQFIGNLINLLSEGKLSEYGYVHFKDKCCYHGKSTASQNSQSYDLSQTLLYYGLKDFTYEATTIPVTQIRINGETMEVGNIAELTEKIKSGIKALVKLKSKIEDLNNQIDEVDDENGILASALAELTHQMYRLRSELVIAKTVKGISDQEHPTELKQGQSFVATIETTSDGDRSIKTHYPREVDAHGNFESAVFHWPDKDGILVTSNNQQEVQERLNQKGTGHLISTGRTLVPRDKTQSTMKV